MSKYEQPWCSNLSVGAKEFSLANSTMLVADLV